MKDAIGKDFEEDNDLPDDFMPSNPSKDNENKTKSMRAGTPEARAAAAKNAMRKDSMQEAFKSPGKLKEGDGEYIYRLNPDDSVTIVYDPTGRATGARLKKGGRQQGAYNAIMSKEFGKDPNPIASKKTGLVALGESTNSDRESPVNEVEYGESINDSTVELGESDYSEDPKKSGDYFDNLRDSFTAWKKSNREHAVERDAKLADENGTVMNYFKQLYEGKL